MRLFTSFTCFLQLGAAVPSNKPTDYNDYDYLDFFALVRMLDELKSTEDKYKVANSNQTDVTPTVQTRHPFALFDVPTKLKKVGDGIDVDIEKTSFGLGRKKNKEKLKKEKKKNKKKTNYVSYDEYGAYMVPDSSYADNYAEGSADVVYDDYEDYYFYPDDMRPQPTTTTTTTTTTPRPTTQRIANPTRRPKAPRPSGANKRPYKKIPNWRPNMAPGQMSKPNIGSSGYVSAPRPPAHATNNQVKYSDSYEYEYEYEYYDVFYYDDLGMKKKKTKKRKKRKKKKKKQGKNEPLNYTSGFSCWECRSADSYADCMTRGQYTTCPGGSIGCHIEVRSRRDNKLEPREIEKIEMGCKQFQACIGEHRYNGVTPGNAQPQCFSEDSTWYPRLQWDHSTCRQCCGDSNCNYQWITNAYMLDTQEEWESTAFHVKVP